MSNKLNSFKNQALVTDYLENGFISPVDIIDESNALYHRKKLEGAEQKLGLLHYKSKVHTVLKSAFDLATHNNVLDIVEMIIGPNILLYNVTYVIKEPKSASHVSWHQDMTYWGFSGDEQVSAWLALSEANDLSGAMKMIPGSHKMGQKHHEITKDKDNVLLQGQTVRNVKEELSVLSSLMPGQASFHHGWTLHTSMPNESEDRRIGLNIQYISTNMKQLKNNKDTAICVRGNDEFNYYLNDEPAKVEINFDALERFKELDKQYKKTAS